MGDRRELGRWAAPVALLLLVTIAVVLIHNGLSSGGSAASPPATTAAPAPTTTTTFRTRTTSTTATGTQPLSGQYYVVQSGDTFGAIAARYGTTVAAIEALNPGVNSNSLTVGQKIRVK